MNLYYCLYCNQAGNQKEKAGHQIGYALLSYALKKEYGIYVLPKIEKGSYGKPYFSEYPQIHFNISHCNGMAACVLAEQEIGIDIEGRRRVSQALVNKALTEKERKELQQNWKDNFEMGFLRYWTLKESFIKAIGKGLSYPLGEIEFDLPSKYQEKIFSNQKDWCFFQTILKESYFLSVCHPQNKKMKMVYNLKEIKKDDL